MQPLVNVLPVWFLIIIITLICVVVLGGLIFLVFGVIKLLTTKNIKAGSIEIGNRSDTSINMSIEALEKVLSTFTRAVRDTSTNTDRKRAADKIDYMVGKLGTIFVEYKKRFVIKMEEKGLEKRVVTGHSDYRTYIMSIKFCLYLYNGSECLKSLLKHELKDMVYQGKEGRELEDYIDSVYQQFSALVDATLEQYYTNTTFSGIEGNSSFRVVTLEDLHEAIDDMESFIKPMMADIFRYAKEVDEKMDAYEIQKIDEGIHTVKTILLGGSDEE